MNAEPNESDRAARRRRRPPLLPVALVVGLLAACVPSSNVLLLPTFGLDVTRSGFVSIDPPGVGDGSALFRLVLEVDNPNKTALKLTALDGALVVRGNRAAAVTFRGSLDVPANGATPLLLDVKVPLGAAPALLDSLAAYVAGAAVPYRLDAAVTVQALGTPLRYPEFTLVSGALQHGFALTAPRLELLDAELRFQSVDSVEVTLQVRLSNPGAIGLSAQLPQLRLTVAGAPAATTALPPVALPAHGSAEAQLTFRFDPHSVGESATAQIQAASAGIGGLAMTLTGGWLLEAPGIATLTLPPTTLLDDALR